MSKQTLLIREANRRGYVVDKKGIAFGLRNNILRLSKTNKGYLSFNMKLNKGDNATRVFIHKLQAYQKFGEKLFIEGLEVRHLNGDSTDNSWDNLELGTHQENMMDKPTSVRNIMTEKGWKSANPRTQEDRNLIYSLLKEGKKYKEISEIIPISKSTLSYMKNNSQEYKDYIASGR